MNSFDSIKDMIPVLIPLVIFQLSFTVYCLINLIKQDKVRFNNKLIWGVVIMVFNIIGGIVYLAIGREE